MKEANLKTDQDNRPTLNDSLEILEARSIEDEGKEMATDSTLQDFVPA